MFSYSVASRQATTPSFPRKRESSASAWIPGLRRTAPGMTGQRGADIRSLSAYSHARRTDPPSFPRKRESSTSAWIPGLRCTAPGMTGVLFPALPSFWAWLASCGFRPPPEGPSPFLSTATKRDEKMPPAHPAFSCASRPDRGLADASLRAANGGHPWPAPAGLIRPGLRCSGGIKGKLKRLAGYRQPRTRCWAQPNEPSGHSPFTRTDPGRRD